MSLKAEEIKILNVDGTPHVVADLPDNVQRMVEIYNHWRQEEMDAKLELMRTESAMRHLSNEIIQSVRVHLAPPEEAAAEAPAAPVVQAAPEVVGTPTSELDEVVATEGTPDV